MKYYLDTSLIIDFILDKPAAREIIKSLNGQLFTSMLGRAETIRSIVRFYPTRLDDAMRFLNSIYLLAITDSVWQRVESFDASVTLSTADSIHIATADLLLEEDGVLATFDVQMAQNAKKLGLQVISA